MSDTNYPQTIHIPDGWEVTSEDHSPGLIIVKLHRKRAATVTLENVPIELAELSRSARSALEALKGET